LLKLYTYAEKIAIYLTPFVLKCNVKIIFYDYGIDCNIQTKDFPSYLPNKQTLILLYRKCHYDLCYSKEYYRNYINYLNLYMLSHTFQVVDDELIKYYENNMDSLDLNQSKIFTKKNGEILKYNTYIISNTISTQSFSGNEFSDIESKKEELMNEISSLKQKLESLDKKCKNCNNGMTL
jgi:hypothetical protein